MKHFVSRGGLVAAARTLQRTCPLAAAALALPLAVACTGTTTIKMPFDTTFTHDWDTARMEEIWHALEEVIELNLEHLNPGTMHANRAAQQLAIDNIERASALKRKVEHRLGQPVVAPS